MASKREIKYLSNALLSLLLLSDLFGRIVARPDPSIETEGESEEAYYGSEGGPNSDSLREDDETPLKDDEPKAAENDEAPLERHEPEMKEHVYFHRGIKEPDTQMVTDKFADSEHANNEDFNSSVKENENSMNEEDRFQSLSKRRVKTYTGNEANESPILLNSGGRESCKAYRKNIQSQPRNQEITGNVYMNDRDQQLNKNIEEADTVEEPHIDHTRRSNRMRKNSKYLQGRDRRQVQETTQKDINVSTINGDADAEISESDEMAIKNQIKELSSEELEELLNSLTEDKRYLLKKILEDNSDDSVMKREITKKAGAGAVEESNCMESGQIDLSETGGLSITASSADSSDISNSTESPQKITTVSQKLDSKMQLNSNDLLDTKVEGNEGAINNDATLNTAAEEKTQTKEKEEGKEKSDFKREANANEFDNAYGSDEMVCPDDVSEILNEETKISKNRNANKREAVQDDTELAEAMKSLEESFPNSKSYDEASADPSIMAPLVRVKRRNNDLKKRSINISPTAYNSENEDEDNEEASEFDNEGFNEHLSNLEKDFANKPSEEVGLVETQPQELSKDAQLMLPQRCSSENTDKENDAMNVGSDSDNVISGVGGVNENLMYNGASRNKRNMERFYKPEIDLNRLLRTTSIVDNNLQATADNMQVGGYQENDAFGPLPRNYEGDLGRYKRVRQVKQ